MRRRFLLLPLLCLGLLVPAPAADQPSAEKGYVDLFNGKDLTGWVNVNCAPGTFFVKNNEIITTGRPTGYLRSEKQYENFILEMEWMHENKTAMGNSGLFVWGDPIPAIGSGYTRGIEVQVLVNFEVDWATSHGDLFSIWGAKCKPDRPHPKGYERCLPSEKRCKGGGEWNHYKVIANNGVLKLEVNGKEVSGVSQSNPRKGYIALESEGAVCHFRNLKIKELPSTNPKPEEIADLDLGHQSLFDGLTFTGWKLEKDSWKASDGLIRNSGKTPLTTEKSYQNVEVLFDVKIGKGAAEPAKLLTWNGKPVELKPGIVHTKNGAWARYVATLTGETPAPLVFSAVEGLELRNLFLREIK